MEYRNYIARCLPLQWPYKVAYEKETSDECDVLVIGGGLAGSFAAINAAKKRRTRHRDG